MRGNGMSRCIDNQGALPPDTSASGFRARHHDEEPGPVPSTFPNPARIGWAATACPVASTFGAFPQNPAPAVSPADINEQERGPCTPIHDQNRRDPRIAARRAGAKTAAATPAPAEIRPLQ